AGTTGGPRGAIERFGDQVEGSSFNLSVVLRLSKYIRPYWLRLVIAFLAMIVSSILTLVIPYLVKVAIDGPIAQGDSARLNQIALIMLTALMALYIVSTAQRYLLSWVGQRVL